MSDDSAVDVILPTFCRPHTVAFAIQSVLEQSHANLRLHVVGDGCDLATETIVRGFADPRVSFRRFPKGRGYGYANRNAVLRETTAPFIAYMCDDDLWFPDHLERGLHVLRTQALDLVAVRSVAVQYPDLVDPYFFAFDWQSGFAQRFLRPWVTGGVNCIHRRSVFDTVGYWNDSLYRFGDREFYNRVRRSLETRAVDDVTFLRFYARHWDHRYRPDEAPPRSHYAAKVRDRAFRDAVQEQAKPGPRSGDVRMRQWRDFMSFGFQSGPKFLRFLWERQMEPLAESGRC